MIGARYELPDNPATAVFIGLLWSLSQKVGPATAATVPGQENRHALDPQPQSTTGAA